MSRRALLALSAAAAAFVLVLGGAAASLALRSPQPAASKSAATETVPVDLVRAREAEYRRLIDEANAQLRAPEPAQAPMAQPERPREHDERGRHHEREEDDDG